MKQYLRALKYSYPYRSQIFIILALVLFSFIVTLAPPYFIKRIIDDVLIARNIELLNLFLLAMGGIFVIGLSVDFLQNYLAAVLLQKLDLDIKCGFFKHLLKLSLKFFKKRRTGDLVYRLFNDTDVINSAVSITMINVFMNVVILLVVAGILVYMNWKLALIVFFMIPLHILIILKFRNPIVKYSTLVKEKDENMSGNVLETFSGVEEMKTYSTEQYELERFVNNLRERLQLNLKSMLIMRFSGVSINSINTLWSFGILWYGAREVAIGSLSIGSLMAFFTLAGRLFTPVSFLANTILGFQDVLVRLGRFYHILDTKPEVKEEEDALELPLINGAVKFENVSFSYVSGSKILNDISFEVEPGEVVAIVGRSGVGKTTLTNLLARFYDPESGIIYIDGYDINKVKVALLRKQIGIVLQKPYLFSGTVEENIKYGTKDNVNQERIMQAAKNADAHKFIMELPDKYKTEIGERGVKLSGGQQQRIVIARVFLKNPRILILDEAVSALDLESEAVIYHALRQLMQGRTVFIIAHRLSTIQQADKIVVLENKHVQEIGTHQELLQKDGIYRELYERIARI